jgi:pentatricopeptide repeat domain-containing protein 1
VRLVAEGQRWQDGVRLLHEMKSTHAASGVSDNADSKPDAMGDTTAIAGCSKAR